MVKVDFWLEIGYANAGRKETFEYPDDVTNEELEQDQAGWAANYLDSGYYKHEENS